MTINEAPLVPPSAPLRLKFGAVTSTGGAMLVSYVLSIAISIATARLLGPAAKGQIAAVVSWVQILTWVSTFGLNIAISVRVARSFTTPGGVDELRACLGNSVLYSVVVGVLVAVAAMVALSHLLSGLGPGLDVLLLVSLVGLPAGILSSILLSTQLSLERSSRFTAAQIAGPGVSGLYLVARYGVTGRLHATDVVGAALVATACVLLILAKGLPWRSLTIQKGILGEDLRFGGAAAVGAIFNLMSLRLDLLILSVMLSPVSIGLYAAANNLMVPILVVPAAAAAHLTPKVAKRIPNAETTSMIFREALLFTACGAVGGIVLAAAAPILVPLALGEAYRPVTRLVWILVPGFIARGFTSLLVAGAVGQRRPKVGNVAELVGVLVTVAALALTLPRLGVVGAAWASSASYLISAVGAATVLRRIDTHERAESQRAAVSSK